jgi:hypothetical protein
VLETLIRCFKHSKAAQRHNQRSESQITMCDRMQMYNIMNCSQTKSIYTYLNCKRKLLHCNANINFNKTCLKKKSVPKYAQINIKINNIAARKTQPIRIKNKIKFLYGKKCTHYRHTENKGTNEHD